MDVTSAVGSVLAAFGLSGAAGLNAWIPLLATAILGRAGFIDLSAPYDGLESTPVIVLLAVAFAADFVGDKVPVVDHALHAAGTVVHPVAGALVFAASTSVASDLPPVVGLLAGALVSGSLHAGRATVRPMSTASTAGAGNPLLSLGEDVSSAVLTALAVLVPILAVVLLIAGAYGLYRAWRRLGDVNRGRPART
jgi:Domain of unknown function (DUF4126)